MINLELFSSLIVKKTFGVFKILRLHYKLGEKKVCYLQMSAANEQKNIDLFVIILLNAALRWSSIAMVTCCCRGKRANCGHKVLGRTVYIASIMTLACYYAVQIDLVREMSTQ